MSVRVDGNAKTFTAGADLSSSQYHIVKLDSNDDVVAAAASTDVAIGFVNNQPESGDTADVTLRSAAGTALVKAGGSISAGDRLTSDANGKAVPTTTADDEVVAVAMFSASSNDVTEVIPTLDRY